MVISLVVFSLSFFGLIIFLFWKAPIVASMPERKNQKDFLVVAKEKFEEEVKREVGEKVDSFLQSSLSLFRKFLIRIEKITTKWLYKLKRKRKKKEKEDKEGGDI